MGLAGLFGLCAVEAIELLGIFRYLCKLILGELANNVGMIVFYYQVENVHIIQ